MDDGSSKGSPDLTLVDVTIGVLTALEEEYAACRLMFDPEEKGASVQRVATSGHLTCWLCQVDSKHGGAHIVAISMLPDMGNNAAAIAANILLQHCPAIKHLIMCGIAGGTPHPTKASDHVRLGDIVVCSAQGVIQYDRGKKRVAPTSLPGAASDPFAGFELRSPPRAPCPVLLGAVKWLHSDETLLGKTSLRPWDELIDEFVRRREVASGWARPGKNKDKLDDSPDGTGPIINHPTDNERRSRYPRVFRAPIGAANIVLADPAVRNALRDKYNVRAVEMEGFGIADASWVAGVGYLVVRGICDYCNSTKNDIWHKYAALVAAAYTLCVLRYLNPVFTAETTIPMLSHNVRSGIALAARQQLSTEMLSDLSVDSDAKAVVELSPSVATTSATKADATIQTTMATVTDQTRSSNQLPNALEAASQPRLEFTIETLVSEGLSLLKEGRHRELSAVASELERQLGKTTRKGRIVRDGWLLLAKIEVQELFVQRNAGKEVDLQRLNQLRKEADSVVD